MLYMLIAVLAVALVILLVRYIGLRREVSRLADAMDENHSKGATRQLTIGVQQPQLARLATNVNVLYDDMDADRAASRTAVDEMRQSMANVSHDLRTPLTSIIGYLKLLRSEGNSPQQQEHYWSVAYKKSLALHTLVEGLFELSRLESGSVTFDHQRLDAAALLAEELAGAYPQMEEKGLLPDVQLPEAPLWVIADRDVLRRVFANLLQNMLVHGQNPMGVTATGEEGTATFCFSNRAPGLSQQDIPQLFQRFFTADRMRSGKDTGLGLAIVQELTRQMGGACEAVLEDDLLTLRIKFPLTV